MDKFQNKELLKQWAKEVYNLSPCFYKRVLGLYSGDYASIVEHLFSRDWNSFDEAWEAWDTKLRRYLDGDA